MSSVHYEKKCLPHSEFQGSQNHKYKVFKNAHGKTCSATMSEEFD